MANIAIINYALGNLRSVYNAIGAVGGNAYIAHQPNDIDDATHVILPGVGSFNDGITQLKEHGWIEVIERHVHSGRPFLGICLGMQLLATEGFENGCHRGLDIIPGRVERLTPNNGELRVPHVGWNDVTFSRTGKLNNGVENQADYYFVHSYAFIPNENGVALGTCDYGGRFVAVLEHENVFATQFHPEKSQKAGLALLKNFVELV